MRKGGMISGAGGRRRQSKLPLILGLAAAFVVSVALGFYIVGPQLMGGGQSKTASTQQAEAPKPVAPPEPEPETAPKLKINITEEKPATPEAKTEEPAQTPKPEVTADKPATEPVPGTLKPDQPAAGKPSAPTTQPPKETSKPAPKPAPTATKPAPPAASSGIYRVQLGVFSEETVALQIAEQARSRGVDASVVAGVLNGNKAWRVQGGAFRDKAAAEKQRKKLTDAGLQSQVLFSAGE